MSNVLIYGGTTKAPKGVGLCATCRQCTLVKGEGISDERVFCGTHGAGGVIQITRPVCECSSYVSRNSIHESELEKTAWILKSDAHGHIRFVPPE